MNLAFPAVLLLGPVLLAMDAVAGGHPPLPTCEQGIRRIELGAVFPGKPLEVCISPGLSTNLFFDSVLAGVELQERERFRWISEGKNLLTLIPSEMLLDGSRVPLTVHFLDGAAPTSATFVLVMHPALAERQVEVFRHPRTLASYQQGEQQARSDARRCEDEKLRLQTECGGQGGFTGAIASGWVARGQLAGKNSARDFVQRPEDTVRARDVYTYRSTAIKEEERRTVVRLAVELWLLNQGTTPWLPEGAALVGPGREALKALGVWAPEPIPPGESRRVVVELEATEEQAGGIFTLGVWDETGTRSVSLANVTFP